jgi:hypothetical protein
MFPNLAKLKLSDPVQRIKFAQERLRALSQRRDFDLLLENCATSIKEWKSLWKAGATREPLDESDDPNPVTFMHPRPEIKFQVFDGEASTHQLTELLHNVLHSHWPCHVEGHNHKDRLGQCQGAKFYLNPRWSLSDLVQTFSVILSGRGILQECKFNVPTKR